MRATVLTLALIAGLTGCNGSDDLSIEDEFSFRRLRQEFHTATTTGDVALMRSLWTDDAVLTAGNGDQYVGPDGIAAYLAANPNFGNVLMLTSESRWNVRVQGDTAQYAFESIAVDMGGNDPRGTLLSDGGSQNPIVQIVAHTHSMGTAARAADGRWQFQDLSGDHGPLPPSQLTQSEEFGLPIGDELGFRRMRERFHLATITGDRELLRTVWAEDAVFRGGPNEIFGQDAIVDFMAGSPSFGRVLVLTPESSSRIAVQGGIAQYAFECITIDVGDGDPLSTPLCSADGSQNPAVEIVRHTNTSGFASRLADGRWVFREFYGAIGPLADG